MPSELEFEEDGSLPSKNIKNQETSDTVTHNINIENKDSPKEQVKENEVKN